MCCYYCLQIQTPRVGAPLSCCLPQGTQKILLWLYEFVQLMSKWHARWNDTERTFLYTADQKEAPQREMPFVELYLHEVLGFGSAWSWEVPVEATRPLQSTGTNWSPNLFKQKQIFHPNFHGSYVIDWLLTRKVVKCLRAVKCWQGDVWDAGAGGRDWEPMSQWVVS